MAFTVINQGRGEVSIDGFHIAPYGGQRPKARRLKIEQTEGEPLPHRLPGNSRLTWFANVLPIARRSDAGLRDGSISHTDRGQNRSTSA
jgi:ABC-type Na+ transport system ATPase subunit NatA